MKKKTQTLDKSDQILSEVRGLGKEVSGLGKEVSGLGKEVEELRGLKDEVRRLGVVIEHVDGKVDLLAEQYGDIEGEIGGIQNKLDTHTEMLGGLAVDMEIVKSDIELIKSGLRKKVDVEEFEVLEKRVAALEKRR